MILRLCNGCVAAAHGEVVSSVDVFGERVARRGATLQEQYALLRIRCPCRNHACVSAYAFGEFIEIAVLGGWITLCSADGCCELALLAPRRRNRILRNRSSLRWNRSSTADTMTTKGECRRFPSTHRVEFTGRVWARRAYRAGPSANFLASFFMPCLKPKALSLLMIGAARPSR